MSRMNQQVGRGRHNYRGDRQLLAKTREELEQKIQDGRTYRGQHWQPKIDQLPNGQWRATW